MKTKFKLSVLAVFSLCLVTLPSYVTSQIDAPGSYIQCETESEVYAFYSTVAEVNEVECSLCELVRSERLWNSEGLLEGTLYEYDMGSEPVVLSNTECAYSPNINNRCTEQTVRRTGSGCDNFFVPCTKEDDAECVHD